MATTSPTPSYQPDADPPCADSTTGALVRADAPEPRSVGSDPALAAIPIELDVSVPVRDFRVRNLLALKAGDVIGTRCQPSDDLPLAAGSVRLAGCEFEVVDTQLAVRVTRLA